MFDLSKIDSQYHLNSHKVDHCMRNLIFALNSDGFNTLACCCGHGKYPMSIIYKTPEGKIVELLSGIEIPRKRRFYIKDANGYSFVPELILKKDL